MTSMRLIQVFDAVVVDDRGQKVMIYEQGGEKRQTIEVPTGASPEEAVKKAGFLIISKQ